VGRSGAGYFIDDCGQGPPIVLLHGTPSRPDDFAPLVERLSRQRRVLVPHLPGYGKTPAAASSALDDVTARLEDSLLEAGAPDVAVVAFSGGAYKAVAMALNGRITVRRLALLAPVVGVDADVGNGYRAIANAFRSGALDPRPTWLTRMASPGLSERDAGGTKRARILSWLDAVPTSVICDELVAMADAPDLRPRIRELTCPVLVAAGTADGAVPHDESRRVAAEARDAVFHSVEGRGHALLVEAPHEVIELVARFLGDT
jgi:pimeloyl-ACP methyl ester carboxylesterase